VIAVRRAAALDHRLLCSTIGGILMRTVLTGVLACASWVVVATAVARQPKPPPARRIPARPLQEPSHRDGILAPTVPATLDLDKEFAGLPRGSRPELLTWEQVLALALVLARAGGARAAEALDPKTLAEQAERHGVGDYTRFREDFLAGRPEAGDAFRDPCGDFLQLLGRLQEIDNARRNVAVHENLGNFVRELIQGEAAGLRQSDVALVQAALLQARQGLADNVGHFRDGLDELKVALGLSPRVAVLPDRRRLAAFHDAFEAMENWSKDPSRNLAQLPRLVGQLPAVGDLMADGQAILSKIEHDPDRREDTRLYQK
jgi:hypothetical protein